MAINSKTQPGQTASVIDSGVDGSSGPGPYVMAAGTLQGNPVENSAGESLGDIKAIMLDVPRGRIAYAVLSFGGILGIGDKLFAIPWSSLALTAFSAAAGPTGSGLPAKSQQSVSLGNPPHEAELHTVSSAAAKRSPDNRNHERGIWGRASRA